VDTVHLWRIVPVEPHGHLTDHGGTLPAEATAWSRHENLSMAPPRTPMAFNCAISDKGSAATERIESRAEPLSVRERAGNVPHSSGSGGVGRRSAALVPRCVSLPALALPTSLANATALGPPRRLVHFACAAQTAITGAHSSPA
jgi:hypothetical protein